VVGLVQNIGLNIVYIYVYMVLPFTVVCANMCKYVYICVNTICLYMRKRNYNIYKGQIEENTNYFFVKNTYIKKEDEKCAKKQRFL